MSSTHLLLRASSWGKNLLRFILFIVLLHAAAVSWATDRTWVGITSTAWNTATNWSPSGVPATTDNVIINVAARGPLLDVNRTVAKLTMSGNTLNLNTKVLTYTGGADFLGGTVSNGTLTSNSPAGTLLINGTTFSATVNGSAQSLIFSSGSTFSAPVDLTQTGPTTYVSNGGSAYNSTLTLTVAGTGGLAMAYSAADAYNGNLTLNCTTAGGISFGQGGGTATLASGRTVTIGGTGFTAGNLFLRNFTQVGATAQTLSLGTGAMLRFESGTVFNGNFTSTAGNYYFNGGRFNAGSKFTKTGSSGNANGGGNIFNGTTEFVLNAGELWMAESGADQYNGNVVLNNTSGGRMSFGYSGGTSALASGYALSIGSSGGFTSGDLLLRNFTQAGTAASTLTLGTTCRVWFNSGNTFGGPMTASAGCVNTCGSTFNGACLFTKTGTGADASTGGNTFNGTTEFRIASSGWFRVDYASPDQFNGNILVSCTSTGTIQFGESTGSATLASGKTIAVNPTPGFTNGTLRLRNFTQVGNSTPQNIYVDPTNATLYLETGNTFNSMFSGTAANLYLNGSTYNGPTYMAKYGATNNDCIGGNTFNNYAQLSLCSTANWRLNYSGVDAYNGDLRLNNTSTGTIAFGQGTGSATLASGYTIAQGAVSYAAGVLRLRNFTQLGNTAQSITLGSGASFYFETGTTFNGSLSASSGDVYLNGSTFNGTNTFSKTGAVQNNCTGGNTFNGTTELYNTNTGIWNINYTGTDQFNGDLRFSSSSTGTIGLGQSTGTGTLAAGRSVGTGVAGFNAGILRFRNFTQLGSAASTLNMGVNAILMMEYNAVFNGPITTSSGQFFLQAATFNAAASFTKTLNGTTDSSTGGNTFNGTTDYINASTGAIWTASTFADTYNGDLRVSNTSTGEIRFGYWTATSTLASGRSVSVGALGFASGILGFYHFTQLGTATSVLSLGVNATVEFDQSSVFNGPMQASAGAVNLMAATFNNTATFTKTGTIAEGWTGGCTFNGLTELICTSAQWFRVDYASPDQFNGDLRVSCTNTGAISFGENTGSATLAAGRSISVGSSGFTNGMLRLRNFTQFGNASSVLNMGVGATCNFVGNNTFNGPITTTSGSLLVASSAFNAPAAFTKTGASGDSTPGGNTFASTVSVLNSGSGLLNWCILPDVFGDNAAFVRTGSGQLVVGYSTHLHFTKNVSTTGSTNTVQFGTGTYRTYFDGSTVQQFTSDAAYPPTVLNLSMATTGDGKLDLLGSITVGTDIAFTSGIIRPQAATSSSNGLLILSYGIGISDPADASSYVDGFVRKIGNVAFTFPVGNAGYLAPITITPSGGFATDHFTAKYTWTDPNTSYNVNLHDASLHHISRCEYWVLDRTGGTANGKVTLPWATPRSCGVTNLADLSVAHWNGSTWKDEGHGTTTGTTTTGTIQTANTMSTFSPFTLASFSVNNPLPIELLSFTAVAEGAEVRTQWATASERNNERFEVERSGDGEVFTKVGTLPGAGDSQQELHYELMDEQPLTGLSYYRLKQVDLDGTATYSDVVPVYFSAAAGANGMRVFPNPAATEATVSIPGAMAGRLALTLWNAQGQQVRDLSKEVAAGDVAIAVPLEGLAAGVYVLRAEGAQAPQEVRLIKQ